MAIEVIIAVTVLYQLQLRTVLGSSFSKLLVWSQQQ